MQNNIFRVFHWVKRRLQPPDLSRHATRIRQFVHDYGLPMIATVLFLILVISGAYIRDLQHISVAAIIESLDSREGGYGKLLSNDKTSQLTVDNDSSIAPGSTNSSRGTASSFSINTNNPANGGSSAGGGVSAPFTATISSFAQTGVTLQCSKPKPRTQWCSKQYAFSSGIRSQNGPGTINYSWRSTVASAVQNGSISVGGGVALTSLAKTITLQCDQPINFTLQFIITKPGSTQSAVKNINHNCNEL